MINIISDIVNGEEIEPPSKLIDLGHFLNNEFKNRLNFNFGIRVNGFEEYIEIIERTIIGNFKIGYLFSVVYFDKEVADNTHGVGLEYRENALAVRVELEKLGYISFHNPFSKYVEKRREQIYDKKLY